MSISTMNADAIVGVITSSMDDLRETVFQMMLKEARIYLAENDIDLNTTRVACYALPTVKPYMLTQPRTKGKKQPHWGGIEPIHFAREEFTVWWFHKFRDDQWYAPRIAFEFYPDGMPEEFII